MIDLLKKDQGLPEEEGKSPMSESKHSFLVEEWENEIKKRASFRQKRKISSESPSQPKQTLKKQYSDEAVELTSGGHSQF